MQWMRVLRAAANDRSKTTLLLGVVGALWWSAAAAQSELVIFKEGTILYHRAGCDVIRDMKGVVAMTRAQAESRGYKAHADCDPEVSKAGAPAPPGSAASPAAQPKPAPQIVYVDGGKYYHRKDCRRLAANPKAARAEALEVAGKSLWPCPDCRPPVRPRQGTSPRLGRVR
jgi:hypothetical protein